jgi:AraC-like DNA-binding protein
MLRSVHGRPFRCPLCRKLSVLFEWPELADRCRTGVAQARCWIYYGATRPAPCARAHSHTRQAAGRLLRRLPGACGVRVRCVPGNSAAGTRPPGRLETDVKGTRAADALLEVREEGRRGSGGCQAETTRRTEEPALNGKLHCWFCCPSATMQIVAAVIDHFRCVRAEMHSNRSKRLLRAAYEIADAATITGFVGRSHFTHTLKRWLRITPARYRAQVSGVDRHS